jgi:hypothetical protein
MFTIEYVVVRGRDHPGIVERMTSASASIAVAEQSARAQLERWSA